MAKNKVKKTKAPSPKKEIRQQITDKLRAAVTDLDGKLSKKELENRIKKAAKILTTGIKIKTPKPAKSKSKKEESVQPEEKKPE